jgi:hypothetical protein
VDLPRTLSSLAVLALAATAAIWTVVREREVVALRAERDALRVDLAATQRAAGETFLERELEAQIEHVRWLARRPQDEPVARESAEAWRRLHDLFERAEHVPWLRPRIQEWRERSGEEWAVGPRLQLLIGRGNAGLRALKAAIQRKDWTAAEEAFDALERVRCEMRLEDREVFHRNARALHGRAVQLARESKQLDHVLCCPPEPQARPRE